MGRGRKVNSSGERSRKLLREKAIELFSENGYFQTKISDIVKAANVTQPTFYLYFKSKEDLYKEITTEFLTNMEKIIQESVNEDAQHSNTKQSFQVILTRLFTYFAMNPELTKIGIYECVPIISAKLTKKYQHLLEEYNHHLQNKDVSIHIFTESLIGSVEKLTLSTLLTQKMEPEQLAEQIVNIYFANEEAVISA